MVANYTSGVKNNSLIPFKTEELKIGKPPNKHTQGEQKYIEVLI